MLKKAHVKRKKVQSWVDIHLFFNFKHIQLISNPPLVPQCISNGRSSVDLSLLSTKLNCNFLFKNLK